jgi:hypothetical protein
MRVIFLCRRVSPALRSEANHTAGVSAAMLYQNFAYL